MGARAACRYGRSKAAGTPAAPSVPVGAGRQYHGVEQVVPDALTEPAEVARIIVGHATGTFDLDGEHAPFVTNDDEVDLLRSVLAEVPWEEHPS